MKLKKSTLILLTIAILFAGGIYIYEFFGKSHQEQIESEQKQLFSFSADAIKGLTIDSKGQSLQFARTEDTNNPWRMQKPELLTASDAAVSFLVNLLVEAKRDRSIKVPVTELKEYGLASPMATITIKLKDEKSHQLILGNPNLEDSYLYAQIDPQTAQQEVEIILVPKEFQYAVERDLNEWKQTEIPASPSIESTPK
jgi:hypothetical protein